MRRTATRNARTGRFTTKRAAVGSARTTTTERIGRGTSNAKPVVRSARTGRFVPSWMADRYPDATIRQWV